MIAESLVSLLGGGLLRVLPEVLNFFDRKHERTHELSMMSAQMELRKQEAASALAIEHERHESAVDAGMVQAMVEAMKSQAIPTGIRWVDALNALVRPSVTYAMFALYAAVRVVILITALKQNPAAWATIIVSTWTPDDMAMLSAMLGFWFCNRSLMVGRK